MSVPDIPDCLSSDVQHLEGPGGGVKIGLKTRQADLPLTPSADST